MKVTPQSVDPTNGGIPFLTVQQTIAAKPILMDGYSGADSLRSEVPNSLVTSGNKFNQTLNDSVIL